MWRDLDLLWRPERRGGVAMQWVLLLFLFLLCLQSGSSQTNSQDGKPQFFILLIGLIGRKLPSCEDKLLTEQQLAFAQRMEEQTNDFVTIRASKSLPLLFQSPPTYAVWSHQRSKKSLDPWRSSDNYMPPTARLEITPMEQSVILMQLGCFTCLSIASRLSLPFGNKTRSWSKYHA